MKRLHYTWLFCLVALLSLAAANSSQPDITSPFGSQAFTVSWLQSPHPDPSQVTEWSTPTPCAQSSAPTEMYADDPETWTTQTNMGQNSWTYTNPGQQTITVNNLQLMKGSLGSSSQGLIYFYFDNELGVTARLYIGGTSGQISTTIQYVSHEITGPADSRSITRDGAMETAAFLSDYQLQTGLTSKTLGPSSLTLPTNIVTYSVANGNLIQGEMWVTNLNGPATFYVYADDCTGTPCPSLQHINLNGDNHFRRGDFLNASFVVGHDSQSEINNGGFAWYDMPGGASCLPTFTGVDPYGEYTPRNSGDYGATINITGTPGRTQFWFIMMSPAATAAPTNVPDAFAFYLQGMQDPSTHVDVTGSWALAFPTSNPPTPSPQPTATPVLCCSQSAVVGEDLTPTFRTITWIPSGGEVLPARFWYEVATGR